MKNSINVKTDVAFKEHIAAASSNMFCRNKAMQNPILVQDGWKSDTERYKMFKGRYSV